MKLINGVFVYASWESWINYYKSLNENHRVPTEQRLAKLLASALHVTLSILEEETLEWDYKLKCLIKQKDFKQANETLDMLIALLQRKSSTSDALRAANHLRGAWCEMKHLHSRATSGADSRMPNASLLRGTTTRILDNVALLLGELRVNENVYI